MNSRWHEEIFALCLIITYMVILNKYVFFVVGSELFTIGIDVAEWVLLLLLVASMFSAKGHVVTKSLLLLFAFKIIFYVVYRGQFNFQKSILTLPLLLMYAFESVEYRRYCLRFFQRHYTILLTLFLGSFLPFAWFYNRYFAEVDALSFEDVYRLGGLWELPHVLAYFLLVMMILNRSHNIMLNLVLFGNVLLTGVRSALIASAVYIAFLIIRSVGQLRQKKGQLVLVILFVSVIVSVSPIWGFIEQQYEIHITPLLVDDISDPTYGKGRIVFNLIALQDLRTFDIVDAAIGRSATALYDLYVAYLGIRSWPHNDYVTVFYVYGAAGFLLYMYALFVLPNWRVSFDLRSGIPLITGIVFVLALTNGFYTYPSIYLFSFAYAIYYQEWLDRPASTHKLAITS